ncbi:MAG: 16S rRNA (cytidine(1402)-2'-O)-methyltransferase [Parvularculaceae bacterium]
MPLDPGLYVAATPIGNLKDVTYRVIEALSACDTILCEDTRQTAKLCAAYGVKTERRAYHEHNAERTRPEIIARLKEGARICLVSDAGTPLISDPGYKLVREARDAGVSVFPLPGPCAAIAALSAAGAPTDRFLFAGFAPTGAARLAFFRKFAAAPSCLVFYETGPRLAESLRDMEEAFGDRKAVIARELTKIHEEFREGALSALADGYAIAQPRGEIVVIVFPPAAPAPTPAEIDAFLAAALPEMSVRDAAAAAADGFGVTRREAYERALRLKSKTP